MQQVIRRIRANFQGHDNAVARQVVIAIGVYLIVAAVAVGIGFVYLSPPGHRTVVFLIDDGAAIRPGEEVRVAGVPSGRVTSVRLLDDAVRVELAIDDGIFVGDRSAVEVRMLTAAGGYYVNVESMGMTPLGSAVIPADRARSPYQLPQLLADSAVKLEQVNAPQLGADLDRLAKGLETNPGAITTITRGVQVLAQVVKQQRTQLRTVFDTAQEFVNSAEQNRPMLIELLQNAALLLTLWDGIKFGLSQAAIGLGRMLTVIGDVGVEFYNIHRDWLLDAMQRTNNALNVINTDIPRIIWNLGNFIDNLRNATAPNGRRIIPPDQLLSTDICVPVPGRTC